VLVCEPRLLGDLIKARKQGVTVQQPCQLVEDRLVAVVQLRALQR